MGVGAQIVMRQIITQGNTTGFLLSMVIIALGVFLFFVAFMGCCGVCKENYCLVITVSKVGPAWVLGPKEGHFCGGDGKGCMRWKTFLQIFQGVAGLEQIPSPTDSKSSFYSLYL